MLYLAGFYFRCAYIGGDRPFRQTTAFLWYSIHVEITVLEFSLLERRIDARDAWGAACPAVVHHGRSSASVSAC